MKNKRNIFNESVIAFKKIDKIVSKVFLYFSSICGFIFGWICLGIIFLSTSETIPGELIFVLRLFYFLISFLLGLKLTLFFMKKFRKRNSGV